MPYEFLAVKSNVTTQLPVVGAWRELVVNKLLSKVDGKFRRDIVASVHASIRSIADILLLFSC